MIRRTKLTFDAQRWKAEEALAREGVSIMVCAGTGCIASGAMAVYETLHRLCKEKGLPVSVSLSEHADDAVHLKKTGCHGFCEIGPLVNISPMNVIYTHVKPEDCEEIIEKTIKGGKVIQRLLFEEDGKKYKARDDIPFYLKQQRLILRECGLSNCEDIWEYIAKGGYSAFEKALFEMTDEQICMEVISSGLRGRGGGGFPTGKKWDSVRRQDSPVKYMRRKHNVLVGERTAELMKMQIGCVFPKEQETSIEIKGRCLVTGLPKVINVSSTEMLEAFEEPVERILEAVHGVLERTPPELVADISNNGIVMTGGGSLVDGFDKLIEARTGIHTVVAEGAISCVAEGTGKSLDSLNAMTDGTVNLSRRKQMN